MDFRVPIAELVRLSGAALEGDEALAITGVASLERAGPGDLSFLANPKYAPQLATTRASAVFASRSILRPEGGPTFLRVDNPDLAFARATRLFDPTTPPQPGVHPSAVVHPSATLGVDVSIGPLCYIGEGSRIGDRTALSALVAVGEEVTIGEDCLLHAHVSIRERCVLGDRVVIQNGAQIGGDGYGFAPDAGKFEKIPQIGNVIVGDDVEIGALCAIDRARLASTIIGEGTKLDDMVMVGHNVEIGPHCLLVAQVGLSGSTKLGHHVVLGGQTGVNGHIQIEDMVQVAGMSGVAGNLKKGGIYAGLPAIKHKAWLKQMAAIANLDSMRKEIRALRREVDQLKKEEEDQ